MKIDLIELEKDIKEGWINQQFHPTLPLRILKYSAQTAYSKEWTPLRLQTRGLVIDNSGEVIVHSFKKFHNHSEPEGIDTLKRNSGKKFLISSKEDGSLIQVAYYKDDLIVTSSGSFTSPQSQKAIEIINKNNYKFQKGFTYIFEIIYKNNQIVLSYGDRESLILLAVKDTESGEQHDLMKWWKIFPLVEHELTTIEACISELDRKDFINKEGYVVFWPETGDRIKLKYQKYCELHKIVSNISEKSIWEALREGLNPEENLKDTPDELFSFVQSTVKNLKHRYSEIEKLIPGAIKELNKLETRKEKALLIQESYKYIQPILFAAISGKDYSKGIWEMIEPENSNSRFMSNT